MSILGSVKFTLLLFCSNFIVLASCQDVLEQNNTKTVDLQDPKVDGTVKAALENGSVSEVVVRKDLLLFPVNAPNLVIAHSQQIHAIPQTNSTNNTDGKPTAAEVAEINEYSLSQLVSTNDTDNETESQGIPISSSSLPSGSQNDSVLEPGKLLEIVSGFNLSNGLATEKVALPDEVQNISLPKQSIVDLLSKPLAQTNASLTTTVPSTYSLVKRSVDSTEDEDDDSDADSTEDDSGISNTTDTVKRSVDSESDESRDSDTDQTNQNDTTSTTTKIPDDISSASLSLEKKSVDAVESEEDSSTSDTTEYYDHEVENFSGKGISSTTPQSQAFANKDESLYGISNRRESLREDSPEDIDVAEDIVFRPLFRYRQETRLRQDYKRSGYRRQSYNSYDSDYGNQYRYKTDNSDYD